MEKLNLNSLTKEQIALASKCQTPEKLIELAKEAGRMSMFTLAMSCLITSNLP